MTITDADISRLLAIGDIHGRGDALGTLLEVVSVDPSDRLVFLGDYIDGGPDSAMALDLVREMVDRKRAVALRGNHDDELINVLERPELFEPWARSRGRSTVQSYGLHGRTGDIETIERRHGTLLRSLRLWHEEPEAIFVHAGVEPRIPM